MIFFSKHFYTVFTSPAISMKISILGASGIGRHHANWWTLEGFRPTSFLGSSPESVASTARNLHEAVGFEGRGYTSLDELLEKERPDIVDVCLPSSRHLAAVRKALEAGAHVLCEKPFLDEPGLSADRQAAIVSELADLAESKKLRLGLSTQYAVATEHCLRLHAERSPLPVRRFEGTLVSPTRGRAPDPAAIWTDLGPHMLAVAQTISGEGEILLDTLQIDFDGHKADASFRIRKADGFLLEVLIHTFHRDEAPANLRQLVLDGVLYDIGGFSGPDGVYQLRVRYGKTDGRSGIFSETPSVFETIDPVRAVIRRFIAGDVVLPRDRILWNQKALAMVLELA